MKAVKDKIKERARVAIIESSDKLTKMPEFKAKKGKGLRLTGKGLISYTFTSSVKDQRLTFIHHRVAFALMGTLETPARVLKKHLKHMRESFADEPATLSQLETIKQGLKELIKEGKVTRN